MWIRWSHYEHLFRALSEARERIVQLEKQNASHVATIEWLRLHVNRLETERSVLTSERLRVLFPTPTIQREPESPRPVEPDAGRTVIDTPVSRDLPADSIPMQQFLSAALEDVGDEMAGRLGVSNDNPEGVLQSR